MTALCEVRLPDRRAKEVHGAESRGNRGAKAV